MPTADEMDAEIRAVGVARLHVYPGTMIDSWLAGALFTLLWAKGGNDCVPPSTGATAMMEKMMAPTERREHPRPAPPGVPDLTDLPPSAPAAPEKTE